MTEYLIEDPDGFLIEIEGGLLVQDDEDGYGPIETRPPAILCCPCPGPRPFTCGCQNIVLLHPALSGLWDIYEMPDPAPGFATCIGQTFLRTEELPIIDDTPYRLRLYDCFDATPQNAGPVPWSVVYPITYDTATLQGFMEVIDPPYWQVVARSVQCCPKPTGVRISLEIWDPSGYSGIQCSGRYMSAYERGRGKWNMLINIDQDNGAATRVQIHDLRHGSGFVDIDPTGWGAYCDDPA